jgi:hypothetical protein
MSDEQTSLAIERASGVTAFDLEAWYERNGIEEHPVVKRPKLEQVLALLRMGREGLEKLKEGLEKRKKLIALMEKDPLNFGWEPECWKDARELLKERSDCADNGREPERENGVRSEGSDPGPAHKPNRIWGFLHSSEDSSKRLQHPRLYRYMPPEWRDLGKVGKVTHVVYSEQRGFADNVFIFPNGSRGFFFNYKQDPKVLEGYEFDGVWADELIPPEFLVALRYRLITRRGRMILTFTPVEGLHADGGRLPGCGQDAGAQAGGAAAGGECERGAGGAYALHHGLRSSEAGDYLFLYRVQPFQPVRRNEAGVENGEHEQDQDARLWISGPGEGECVPEIWEPQHCAGIEDPEGRNELSLLRFRLGAKLADALVPSVGVQREEAGVCGEGVAGLPDLR